MRFEDFCEDVPEHLLPPLDRKDPGDAITMTPDAAFWREHGYLILPKFLPEPLVDAYRRAFVAAGVLPGGFSGPQPFLKQPEMLDICCYPPLVKKIEEVIPTPMAVNLGLTAWISTTRTWHQDDYLNPPYINGWYVAVWMALDDIDPDSGVFEYVPGSHRWPLMRGEKVRAALSPDQLKGMWPLHAEQMVTPLFDLQLRQSMRNLLDGLQAILNRLLVVGRTVRPQQIFQDIHRHVRPFLDQLGQVFANHFACEVPVE